MRRRRFLQGTAAAAAPPALYGAFGPFTARGAHGPFARWKPIAPSDADELLLPEGFRYDVVLRWGDAFTADGRPFGYNNDWIGAFPLGGEGEALLAVNHEYVSLAFGGDVPLYPVTFERLRGRAPTVDDYKRDVGVSILRVRRDDATGRWTAVGGDRLNRRIDAFTPCGVDGPAAAVIGEYAEGTFDNCSGGQTPWGTALTCEENFQLRVPEEVDTQGRSPRGGLFDLPGGHYGWVVEIDPHDPGSRPVKHTALGRFRHENVGLRAEGGRPLAAYMGDDRTGGHVWKFISDGRYQPRDGAANAKLLSAGRLYAARFHADGTGEWRLLDLASPLDPNAGDADPKPPIPGGARRLGDCYASLGAALMDAYRAANALGASPSGRPEDLEVHPGDGSVVIAFTAGAGRPGLWANRYGEVWRLVEDGDDVGATRFRWSRLTVGAPDAGRPGRTLVHPDNLLFDAAGDLWVCSDTSGAVANVGPHYGVVKNNGVFRVPMTGPDRGRPAQFASLPCEAEGTGPAWGPGGDVLFLSVQHPGERHGTRTRAEAAPRGSNWPEGRLDAPPRPAVVAIRRS